MKMKNNLFRKCRLDEKGYSLVELMVVIAIMAILASTGTGIYKEYIEKAKSAAMLNTGHQIKEALLICEAEYLASGGSGSTMYWSDDFLKAPNHEDSVLYPYVGEITKDCVDYSLKIGKDGNGDQQIKGFTYETDEYVIKWRRGEEITVTKQSE